MKYIKLFENFDSYGSYDPYELMVMFPNKKAEMIMREIRKAEPNLNLVSDLILLGANLEWRDDDNGYAPLHGAVRSGNVEIVRMLIDAGADVNVQDAEGRTPLYLTSNEEIARMLIGAGAKLDIQDNWNFTPLHRAARFGEVGIIRMLIGAGADVNVQDNRGETPLHRAAYYGYVEIVRILIDAGARKNIFDYEGKLLPYDLADTEELKNLLRP